MRLQSVLGCLAAAPFLIGASQPVRLAPASKWVLDYADESCRLTRGFGDPEQPTILQFERVAPVAPLSLVVMGKPFKLSSRTESVVLRFLPGDITVDRGKPALTADKKLPAILWSSVGFAKAPDPKEMAIKSKEAMDRAKKGERPPPIDLKERAAQRLEMDAAAAKLTAIEIQTSRSHPVILESGPLGRPLKMLDECTRNQLRGWGVDPDIEDKIVRPAWTVTMTKWFSSDAYPMQPLYKGQESTVEARLLIDATGKITKCTSLSHFEAPEFGKSVCDVFTKRGHYTPAELADGTKVPTYAVARIVFRQQ